MAGISESNRLRVAIALMCTAIVLILVGIAMQFGYPESGSTGVMSRPAPAVLAQQIKVMALRQLLFWSLIFFLLVVVATYAFLKWSRQYRKSLLRKPRPPTPADDVWAMHKLPEGAIEQWTDPGPISDDDK